MGALAVVAVVATAAEVYEESQAASSKKQQFDLENKQSALAYQQKSLRNYQLTQKILSTQLAEASTRGVGLGSPSLGAIRQNTINVSQRNQDNLDTEESISQLNNRLEKEDVQNQLAAQLFGNTADIGLQLAGVYGKMPSAPPTAAKEA